MTESPVERSLEYWAAAAAERTALIDGEASLSFAEWNRAADRLARGFLARGLGAGDIVIARTRTRIEWPIVQAAVGKIGARLLVLNWRLTPAETDYVLGDSAAAAFICDDPDPAALLPVLAPRRLKLAASIDVAADGYERFDELFEDGPPLFGQADPPLIVYTSGTTGFPKGVEAPPKPPQRPSSSPDEVMLINMPMHHASAPNQLIRARFNGWTVVLQRRFDPQEALALIERRGVTQWAGVPTMYKRIFGLPDEVRARYDVSSLRLISTGAGPTPVALKRQIIDYFGPKLAENYGATEVGMLTHLPPELQSEKPDSCGKVIAGVELEIRGDEGEILPAGEIGAIWARTPTTISGYLNRGGDRERFDDRGFFKVGDLGRFDEDGFLYLTDRAIDLIVSGGVNIYPAEIETVLQTHPAVQDAAVVGAPDEDFGEAVIAFVELKPGRTARTADLLAHCENRLASYKRPRRIELVGELPRNTMGKLLKRELRAPLWAGRDRAI